jgi:hypothetical protein
LYLYRSVRLGRGDVYVSQSLLVRVVVATFSLARGVEAIAGGEGVGDVGGGVAGRTAGIGARVLAGEEGDWGGEGEREEGKRQESEKLGKRERVSFV